jgi:PKD repeat protein
MNKMLKRYYFIIACAVISFHSTGQNLVQNNSFENHTGCPTSQAQLFLAPPWDVVSNTGSASPDYYHQCNGSMQGVPVNVLGYQLARTGDGYAGFYTYGFECREYVQAPLLSPLIAGNVYNVEMYVSAGDVAGIGIDAIGLYFSNGAILGNGTYNALPYIPQISNPTGNIISDTLGWTLISGTYTAVGGENYITIGNFLSDSNTNTLTYNSGGWGRGYYLLDDISVAPQNAIPAAALQSSDTIFCGKQCIDFTDLSTNSPTSWQWLFPGADSTSSNLQNPTNICYNSYGSFDVTLIACNASGCDTVFIPDFIVELQPPSATVSFSGDTLFSTPAVAYQWGSADSGLIAGAVNNYFVPSYPGSFYVIVTDSFGCSGTSNLFDLTGITEPDQLHQVNMNNPFSDELTVTVNDNRQKFITIYEMNSKKVIVAQFRNSLTLKTAKLAKGMYVFEIRNQDGTVKRGKILKQ